MNAVQNEPRPDGKLRRVEEHSSDSVLSGAEQRRLLELLSLGIERWLKNYAAVDLLPDVSVDTDAAEEGNS